MLRFLTLIIVLTTALAEAKAQDASGYKAACAGCHPSATALARKITGANHQDRKDRLSALLKRHHAPDPAAADQIIGYLLPPLAK